VNSHDNWKRARRRIFWLPHIKHHINLRARRLIRLVSAVHKSFGVGDIGCCFGGVVRMAVDYYTTTGAFNHGQQQKDFRHQLSLCV
jgi:hypothetical protein